MLQDAPVVLNPFLLLSSTFSPPPFLSVFCRRGGSRALSAVRCELVSAWSLRLRVRGHGLPATGLPLPAVPGSASLLPVLQLRGPPGPEDGGSGSLLFGLSLRSVLGINDFLRLQRAAAVRRRAPGRRHPRLLCGECRVSCGSGSHDGQKEATGKFFK